MKKTKYSVIYLNDNSMIFYCDSFTKAIIMAMAFAIEKGNDPRIKYITDENGMTIRNIQYPTFDYSK